MGKYLDDTGLQHFMSLIKTALSGKQTVGDWIDIHDGNINYGGSAPSSAHWDRVLEIFDANGKGIGYIQSSHATSGTVALSFGMDSVDRSNQNQIFLGWRQNGDPTVSVSVPVKWRDALELGTAATHAHEDYAPSGDYWTGDKGGTSYWGLVNPDGASTGWVRTPGSGLLPAASGGGSSSLGTSIWPFQNIHGENVYINGHKVGDTAYGAGQSGIASPKAAVSVAASTTVNLDTIVLAPGTWLVTYAVEFASNATGYRRMTLTTTATSITSTPVYMESVPAANGFATNISKTQVIVNSGTSNITRYLNVYHTGSAALNCRSCIQAVRIA